MDRRKFFSVTGAGAAAVAAEQRGGGTAESRGTRQPGERRASAKLPPLKARLGHQFGTLTERSAAWVSRYGVDAVCTSPKVDRSRRASIPPWKR